MIEYLCPAGKKNVLKILGETHFYANSNKI